MTPAALVTGSSRGIGLAIALELAGAGFDIALNAEAAGPELDRALDEVRACGVRAAAFVADVADIAGHDRLLAAAEEALGPLTTLVNNAGVGVLSRGDLLDATPASFDRCLAVNARAVFFLTQAFGRRLLARDRPDGLHHSVVTVTSSNAVAVALTRGEYSVSKAAAAMATRCFATRLGPEGINVYEIQPGLIATDMTAPVQEHYRERIADGFTLTRRMGEPADIGSIARALATGQLAYCTGQAILADGGMLVPRF